MNSFEKLRKMNAVSTGTDLQFYFFNIYANVNVNRIEKMVKWKKTQFDYQVLSVIN